MVLAAEGCKSYDSLFFFQAEDGIRDLTVTGVQTCALPILIARSGQATASGMPGKPPPVPTSMMRFASPRCGTSVRRSEERRVGKEYGDCCQSFCVNEYGTANGRLHFHAVPCMRPLPAGSVD